MWILTIGDYELSFYKKRKFSRFKIEVYPFNSQGYPEIYCDFGQFNLRVSEIPF